MNTEATMIAFQTKILESFMKEIAKPGASC